MKKLLVVALTVLMLLAFGIVASAEDAEPVAKVGNTEYATIDEAIANWTNNTTLTLLKDVTLSDTVTLKSTEHHILNLGTYTLTAPSGKDAFVIKAYGTGSSERTAITINADATNPGGINAGSKRIVYYKYADGGISAEDRPIIKINGGVFTSTGNGIYTIGGSAARKAATINIAGGTFNCGIYGQTKSKLVISGGTFNKSVGSQGDSTALRLISGGKFKTFGFMTADSKNTKFWFGTSMGNSNVGLYVDKEGYLVVGGAVITEAGDRFEAKIPYSNIPNSYFGQAKSYLAYSSVKDNGIYYEDAEMAISAYKGATLYITEKNDHTVSVDTTFTGTIVAPAGATEFTIAYPQSETAPAWTLDASKVEAKILVATKFEVVTFADASTGSVIINYVAYNSLAEAIADAQNGDTIKLNADIDVNETTVIPEGLEITIDLNGKKLTAANDNVNLDINGDLTIIDSIGGGVSTMRNHKVYGSLTVESGTLQNIATLGAGYPVNLYGGKVTVNGGTIQAVNNANYAINLGNDIGDVTINAGTVKGNFGCLYVSTAGSKVVVNGGTFEVTGGIGGHCVYSTNGNITISNGTFIPFVNDNKTTSYSVYVNGEAANVVITGGTFGDDLYERASVAGNAGTITVSGGTFESPVAKKYCAYGYKNVETAAGTYNVSVWTVNTNEIFKYLGVSAKMDGTGITVGYEFDKDAYALYCEQNAVTLEFGTHFAVAGYAPVEQSMVEYADVAGQFNVIVTGLSDAHAELKLEMALYIVEGESKQYVTANGIEEAVSVTYDAIPASYKKEEVVA